MSAQPAGAPADALARKRLELSVLDALVRRMPTRVVARQHEISKHRLYVIANEHGYPDREALRRSAARLRSDLAYEAAGQPPEVDDVAVELALRLSAASRDLDYRPFAGLLARSDRLGLVRLIAVLAAMLPPDTDPEAALEWIDVPPEEWSEATVQAEAGRWRAGARDRTAVSGHEQDH